MAASKIRVVVVIVSAFLLASRSFATAEDLVSVSSHPATLFFRPTDAPTCPPAGTRALYFDLSAGTLQAIDSACAVVDIETAGAGGHRILDEGVPLLQRGDLDFAGAGVTCVDSAGPKTLCTIPGGGGGGSANAVLTTVPVIALGQYYVSTVAAAWAGTTTSILCKPYGGGTSTPTAETIAVSGIEAIVGGIVNGVSFDLHVRNPYGLEGDVEFRCIGS